MIGELKQVEERIAQDVKTLRTDYANVSERHYEKLIQVKTAQLAHSDLDRYAKALDR